MSLTNAAIIQKHSDKLLIVSRHVNTQNKQLLFAKEINKAILRYQIDQAFDTQPYYAEVKAAADKITRLSNKFIDTLNEMRDCIASELFLNLTHEYTSRFYKDDSTGNRVLTLAGSDRDIFEPMKELLMITQSVPNAYVLRELLNTVKISSQSAINSERVKQLKNKDTNSILLKTLIANVAGVYAFFGGRDSHSEKSIFPRLIQALFVEIGFHYKNSHEQIKQAKNDNNYLLVKKKSKEEVSQKQEKMREGKI